MQKNENSMDLKPISNETQILHQKKKDKKHSKNSSSTKRKDSMKLSSSLFSKKKIIQNPTKSIANGKFEEKISKVGQESKEKIEQNQKKSRMEGKEGLLNRELADSSNILFNNHSSSEEESDNDFEGFFSIEKTCSKLNKQTIDQHNEYKNNFLKACGDEKLKGESDFDEANGCGKEEDFNVDHQSKEVIDTVDVNRGTQKQMTVVPKNVIQNILNNKDLYENIDDDTVLPNENITESEALHLARLSVSHIIKGLDANQDSAISQVQRTEIEIGTPSPSFTENLKVDCKKYNKTEKKSDVNEKDSSPKRVSSNATDGPETKTVSNPNKDQNDTSRASMHKKSPSNSISIKGVSNTSEKAKCVKSKDTSVAGKSEIAEASNSTKEQLMLNENLGINEKVEALHNESDGDVLTPVDKKEILLTGSITDTNEVLQLEDVHRDYQHSAERYCSPVKSLPMNGECFVEEKEDSDVEDDSDLPLMIPAEVVMSEFSDNEEMVEHTAVSPVGIEAKSTVLETEMSTELINNIISTMNNKQTLDKHPSTSQSIEESVNLTQWQMEVNGLPLSKDPTSDKMKMTVPPDGYKCPNCSDTFFLESSVKSHMERKSVLITLECGPCDAKLTFFNKCSMRDHLRIHLEAGDNIDDDSIEVSVLPLHMKPTIQPYHSPVPKAAKMFESNGAGNSLESPNSSLCLMCDKTFPSARARMSHMQTDRLFSTQRVECVKCSMRLPTICAAKAHILTHPPANLSNVLVCPECGEGCRSSRAYLFHLHTCGHQCRMSGILCVVCRVCFFKNFDDFLSHWVREHCNKSYECTLCGQLFESLVFHSCSAPGQEVLNTFKCVLACPMCTESVMVENHEHHQIHHKIREHLYSCHAKMLKRVHYLFKTTYCGNAFRTKDEMRVHLDAEHRRDNHYRTKTCTLTHEMSVVQAEYSLAGDELSGAYVSLPVSLTPRDREAARALKVPTVTSVIDKNFFPDMPPMMETEEHSDKPNKKLNGKSPSKETSLKKSISNSSMSKLESGNFFICYRCGRMHIDRKHHRKHVRNCKQTATSRICCICKNDIDLVDYVKHCEEHMAAGYILCMLCNAREMKSTKKLYQHFEMHVHEQFMYPGVCPIFNVIFADTTAALHHLKRVHHMEAYSGAEPNVTPNVQKKSAKGKKQFACERCERTFQEKRGLSVHLLTCGTSLYNTNNPMKQCQACSRAFSVDNLTKHLLCHLQEGITLCCLCEGKVLPSEDALASHLKEHVKTLSYPETCSLCSLEMKGEVTALAHLREEHGLDELSCSDCDMTYTFSQQLSRHREIVHKVCQYAKRRYICWICKAFDHVKKDTLLNHFLNSHRIERWQVNEQVMIRTRGLGTMPTSHFVPTKQVKKKSSKPVESNTSLPRLKASPADEILEEVDLDLSNNCSPGGISSTNEEVLSDEGSFTEEEMPSVKDAAEQQIIKVDIREALKAEDEDQQVGNAASDTDVQLVKKRQLEASNSEDLQGSLIKRTKSSDSEYHRGSALHQPSVASPAFVCKECGAKFVVKTSLTRHMFFEHKIKITPERARNTSGIIPGAIKRTLSHTDETLEKKIKVELPDSMTGGIRKSTLQIGVDPLKNLPKISAQNSQKFHYVIKKEPTSISSVVMNKSSKLVSSAGKTASLESESSTIKPSHVRSSSMNPHMININKKYQHKNKSNVDGTKEKSSLTFNAFPRSFERNLGKSLPLSRNTLKLTSHVSKTDGSIIKISQSEVTKNILKVSSNPVIKPISSSITKSVSLSNIVSSQSSKIIIAKPSSSIMSMSKNSSAFPKSINHSPILAPNGDMIGPKGKQKQTFSFKILSPSSTSPKPSSSIVLARSLSSSQTLSSPVTVPVSSVEGNRLSLPPSIDMASDSLSFDTDETSESPSGEETYSNGVTLEIGNEETVGNSPPPPPIDPNSSRVDSLPDRTSIEVSDLHLGTGELSMLSPAQGRRHSVSSLSSPCNLLIASPSTSLDSVPHSPLKSPHSDAQ